MHQRVRPLRFCSVLTCCGFCLQLLLQPRRVVLWLPQLRLSMGKEAYTPLAGHTISAHLQHSPNSTLSVPTNILHVLTVLLTSARASKSVGSTAPSIGYNRVVDLLPNW
eukprot:GHRR01032600.1.p2 GENE.GHRR01032600.1~~GHRR01032600.1.p2  ORF type:complete len:109 (+),score=8.96 GHRR01032600.1:425-751(+)